MNPDIIGVSTPPQLSENSLCNSNNQRDGKTEKPKSNRSCRCKHLICRCGGVVKLKVPNCCDRDSPKRKFELPVDLANLCLPIGRLWGQGYTVLRKKYDWWKKLATFCDHLRNAIRTKVPVLVTKSAECVKHQAIVAYGNLFDFDVTASDRPMSVLVFDFAKNRRFESNHLFCQKGNPNQHKSTAINNHSTYGLSSPSIQTRGQRRLAAQECHTGGGVTARILCPLNLPVERGASVVSWLAPGLRGAV